MVDVRNVQNLPLKVMFIVHFILVTWGVQGYWSPDSYLFYNAFFFLTLLWSIHHKESDEPLQFALAINLVSILLDIMVLAIYFPGNFRSSERFSVAMTILNLVIRPVSCVGLFRVASDRPGQGALGGIFGQSVPGAAGVPRNDYEDIDNRGAHQSVPRTVTIDGSGKQSPPYHG